MGLLLLVIGRASGSVRLWRVLVVILCAIAVLDGRAVEIANPGFERTDASGQADGWTPCESWKVERGAGHNGSCGLVYACIQRPDRSSDEFPRQSVRLVPGKRYWMSALVRTDSLTAERESRALGLTLRVVGFDAKGKMTFDKPIKPCVNGTSGDWVKLEGVTPVVPDGVVRGFVGPAVLGRCVGRGVIDNVFFGDYAFAPVEGVYADVYRGELTVGKVVFHAALNIEGADRPSDCSAAFAYRNKAGRDVVVAGKVVSADEAVAELDVGDFAFGRQEVGCILSCGGRELGRGSAAFTRVKSPTPRKVWIDAHHRTIVDGKPFFPLGMYFRYATASNVEVYADSPFNCLMAYKYPTKEQLDFCQTKGLKVIYNLQGEFNAPDGGATWVRETIGRFRGHPAVLAWYVNDEHPLADIPRLAVRQRWVEEQDPDHPTWSVQDVFPEIRHYLGTYDVLGMDPYPVPKKPIGKVISSLREARRGTFGTRAVWQVPQAFAWGWMKRPDTRGWRAPTAEEMANMTWQAIAGGANGIVYYGFHRLMEPHEDPEDAFDPMWRRVKSVAAEVAKCIPVFLLDEPAPRVTDCPDEIAVRTWRKGHHVYALIVNCTDRPQKAEIRFSERMRRVAGTAFGPVPKLSGAQLAVELPALGASLVKFEQ